MSDSSRPHGLQPTRLLRPWGFPGKSTGVGCHSLLQQMVAKFPNESIKRGSDHQLQCRGEGCLACGSQCIIKQCTVDQNTHRTHSWVFTAQCNSDTMYRRQHRSHRQRAQSSNTIPTSDQPQAQIVTCSTSDPPPTDCKFS